MATRRRLSFDPKAFLAKIDDWHDVGKYRKDQVIFSQGDPADAVFYIQKSKVKLTVVSEQGQEAVIAILGTDEFFGEGCLAGHPKSAADIYCRLPFGPNRKAWLAAFPRRKIFLLAHRVA